MKLPEDSHSLASDNVLKTAGSLLSRLKRISFPASSSTLYPLTFLVLTLLVVVTLHRHTVAQTASQGGTDDWPAYGHDSGGTRYSSLTQINKENVGNLKVAWTFHTGDISDGKHGTRRSGFETTPILVDGTL